MVAYLYPLFPGGLTPTADILPLSGVAERGFISQPEIRSLNPAMLVG